MARQGGARADNRARDGGRFNERGEESDKEAIDRISSRRKRTNKELNPSQNLKDAQDQDALRAPPRGKRPQEEGLPGSRVTMGRVERNCCPKKTRC
jgi:hypothetical protein